MSVCKYTVKLGRSGPLGAYMLLSLKISEITSEAKIWQENERGSSGISKVMQYPPSVQAGHSNYHYSKPLYFY